mmetsp:Transcript_22848/g.38100  ORF Transcript_22848/g.38100 Transcript_22848/m.38100 type:complete len:288 (+) Transcript_22848:4647-5510(+)
MRIICQQRTAGGRAGGRRGPGVGGPGKATGLEGRERVGGGLFGQSRKPTRHTGHKCGVFRQAGDTGARYIGQNIGKAIGVIQRQRHARAQHFFLHMARELQPHQLGDGQTVCGSPRCQRRIEQEEFRRTAPQRFGIDLIKPGVNTSRIGVERRGALLVQSLDRLNRQAIDIQATHKAVDLDRGGAKKLGQPPLRCAPKHHHLPQAVLCMSKAKGLKDVIVGLPKDMRHVGIVAHNLDGGGNRGHAHHGVIVGQGSRGEIVDQSHSKHREDNHRSRGPDQPLKDNRHL